MSTITKPCIKKCALDENEVCTGCYRTFEEMCKWVKVSQREKMKILNKALERKRKKEL